MQLSSMVSGVGGVGLILLSPARRLIYMSHEALGWVRKISPQPDGQGIVPPQILDIVTAVQRHQDFQSRTLAVCEEEQVVVYAFQLPSQGRSGGPILVLLMPPAETGRELLTGAIRTFGLTEREAAVARYLIRGYTNKDIAEALDIAEQTVKQHIRNIMTKTGLGTRSALVSALLQGAPSVKEAQWR